MRLLFVSIPMGDRPVEEIREEQLKILEIVKKKENDTDIELIDTICMDTPSKKEDWRAEKLFYLGKSLVKLSEADIFAMAPGWREKEGCTSEYNAAVHYGLARRYDIKPSELR